jgi:uncharacterized protein (DUF1330 family)
MAKGYRIARVDVHDAERYQQYAQSNGPVFARFGARFLVRGGAFQAPEGHSRSRNVVLEFPATRRRWTATTVEHQALVALRAPAGEADIVLIEGYDGPQPG